MTLRVANLASSAFPATVTDLTVTNNLTLSAGTANGVLFLNASNVVSSGSALTFSASVLAAPNIKVGPGAASLGSRLMVNTLNGTAAGIQLFQDSQESWVMEVPASSTALRWAASGTEQMRLNSTGLGIGTNNPIYKLDVSGSARINSGGVFRLFRTDGITEGLSLQAGTANNFISATTGGFLLQGNSGLSIDVTGNVLWRDNGGGNERMRLDASGNLGLGVTPSVWTGISSSTLETGSYALLNVGADSVSFTQNVSASAGNLTYRASLPASRYRQQQGAHAWFIAPSGTAGNTISFTQAMTLDANGNLSIGTTIPNGRLTVAQDQDALTTIQINNASVGSNAGTRLTLGSAGGSSDIQSRRNGGTTVITTNGVDRLTFDQAGNVVVGNAAIATNATNGFLYVPTCAGTPTGTPTTYTGRSPIVVDTTNNKLYFYSGGQWRDAGP